MKPDIKTKWVQALRSGNYNQGSNYLKTVDSEGITCHCCLGVLCEIYQQETGDKVEDIVTQFPKEWQAPDNGEEVHSFLGTWDVLPAHVAAWAGLGDETNPSVVDPNSEEYLGEEEDKPHTELSALNDNGEQFDLLADLIAEHL